MTARYTIDHEWARQDGEVVVCGVSTHAVEQLGDVVYVELPTIGQKVAKGAAFGVVESAKAVSDVYAPVSGEVVAINEAIVANPQLVNDAPEGEGWFIKLRADNPAELSDLMDAAAYRDFIAAN